jgi:hypothetical protein
MYRDDEGNKVEKALRAIIYEFCESVRALAPVIVRTIFFAVTIRFFWEYAKGFQGLHTLTDRQVLEVAYLSVFSTLVAHNFQRLVSAVVQVGSPRSVGNE